MLTFGQGGWTSNDFAIPTHAQTPPATNNNAPLTTIRPLGRSRNLMTTTASNQYQEGIPDQGQLESDVEQ
jgi:hypothetical protein